MEVGVVICLFAQEDVLMLDALDAVDWELEVELRRAENGGREVESEVESEVEEVPERGVLDPYLREGVWEGEKGSSEWKEALRERKRLRKVKRRELLREEVARVERGEVTAVEVFEERMRKKVEGKGIREVRAEKKWRKKEAWLKKVRERKTVNIAAKRVAAGKVPPPGCAPGKIGFGVNGVPTGARCLPAGKVKPAMETLRAGHPPDGREAAWEVSLLGRLTEMEERLEAQEVREKRRVKEAYEQGRKDGVAWQVKRGEEVERAQKVRRLTWELEEEKRKGLLERRSLEGVGVKDRLAACGSRLPRPAKMPAPKGTVIGAASQWRTYGERWEAAKKRKAMERKKAEGDKALKAVEGGPGMDLMDDEWVDEPRKQRVEAGRGARRPGPGRGGERGVRRTGPGRGALRSTFRATDVRLGEAGVSVVVDRA
jgi:hypothetical protein